jgi:hypothetical protein
MHVFHANQWIPRAPIFPFTGEPLYCIAWIGIHYVPTLQFLDRQRSLDHMMPP